MPDWSSSTPAWDPLSQTPTQIPPCDSPLHTSASNSLSQTPAPLTSPHASSSQAVTHVLLDARLIGVALKVKITDGEHKGKELVISVDERLRIGYTVYKRLSYIRPDWVSPKHPNATRDNGLLVVIKGEHCGKSVR